MSMFLAWAGHLRSRYAMQPVSLINGAPDSSEGGPPHVRAEALLHGQSRKATTTTNSIRVMAHGNS